MKIAPSILSADFNHLSDEIKKVSFKGGADLIHVDVMDGRFVPNISIGVPVVESLAKSVDLPLDVHLMIENPEKFIGPFIDALASSSKREISQDYIVVHAEACDGGKGLINVLKMIKARGVKAGFSVKPGTPIEQYEKALPYSDMVLIMTVEPGFGGQKFMNEMMPKVEWLRRRLDNSSAGKAGNLAYEIEVDGGINAETSKIAEEAGANVLVAGNYIFKSQDYEKAIKALRY
jgi:ribulose-phosphate 3-epimerase